MKRTTSITDSQFEQLTELVSQELAGTADACRVVVLALCDQVRLAVTYLRVNVSQAFLGRIFGVSQATASRIITAISPIWKMWPAANCSNLGNWGSSPFASRTALLQA